MFSLYIFHVLSFHICLLMFLIQGLILKKTQNQPLADVFMKKVFFKILQSSRESICVGVFLSKVAGLQPATLLKQRLQHTFLRGILQNFYKQNFIENLRGTASEGSSNFVLQHKVDFHLRHCKEIKHFHNTHRIVSLKTNHRLKI